MRKGTWGRIYLIVLVAVFGSLGDDCTLAQQGPVTVAISPNTNVTINGLPNGCIATPSGAPPTATINITGCSTVVPPVAVNLTCGAIQIQVGQQMQCTANVTNAANPNAVYSSTNTAVATVNTSGLVTGLAIGTATISATSVQDGTKSAAIPISVFAATPAPTYVHGNVSAGFRNTSATTLQFPYHQSAAANDVLLCGITWKMTTATATVSDGTNGAYTALGAPLPGTGTLTGYVGQIFMMPSSKTWTGTTNQVLVTLSVAAPQILGECVEYTPGILDGAPLYSNAHANSGVASLSGLVTKNLHDIVIAACLGVTATCNVGAGFTFRDDQNAWDADKHAIAGSFQKLYGQGWEDAIVAVQGAQSATFNTTSINDDMIMGYLALAPPGTTVAHSVTLNWSASAVTVPACTAPATCPAPPQCFSAPISYSVYRTQTSGNYTNQYASVLAPQTTYIDTAVDPGQTYYYRVTAYNGNSCQPESSPTNEVAVTIPTGVTVQHGQKKTRQTKAR